jgi:hypothetical protein
MSIVRTLHIACIGCAAAALFVSVGHAATRNNGQIHGGLIKPTSASGKNPTHTPRRGSSSPPWRVGKNSLPNLSTSSNAIAVEHLHIENEGVTLVHPRKKKR